MTGSTLHINAQFLALATGTIVPLLVSLIAKLSASPGLMAVLNGLLAAIAGAIVTATASDGNINWQSYVMNIAFAWLASVAAYHGLWRPTGVAKKIQAKVPGVVTNTAVPAPTESLFDQAQTLSPVTLFDQAQMPSSYSYTIATNHPATATSHGAVIIATATGTIHAEPEGLADEDAWETRPILAKVPVELYGNEAHGRTAD